MGLLRQAWLGSVEQSFGLESAEMWAEPEGTVGTEGTVRLVHWKGRNRGELLK